MAVLSKQAPNDDGIEINFSAADIAGDSVKITKDTVIIIDNRSATSSVTVTFTAGKPCAYGEIHTKDYVIDLNTTQYIGSLEPDLWKDENGYLNITYSDVTDLYIAVITTKN